MGELESKRVRVDRRVCPNGGTQRDATVLYRDHATRPYIDNRKGAAMSKIYSIALLIVSMALANSLGAEERAAKSDMPSEEAAAIPDPSLIPAPTGEGLTGERVRLFADFNGDGREDLALSEDTSDTTFTGRIFTLYLSDYRGKYTCKIGEFFAHPAAIAIEKCGYTVRIWTYFRGGAGEGSLGYQEIQGHKLSEGKAVTIFLGDGCSNIGRAMYAAVFSNSDFPIRAEISTTVDGVVHWKPMYEEELEEKNDEADEVEPAK